jgi:hypothetical protein
MCRTKILETDETLYNQYALSVSPTVLEVSKRNITSAISNLSILLNKTEYTVEPHYNGLIGA